MPPCQVLLCLKQDKCSSMAYTPRRTLYVLCTASDHLFSRRFLLVARNVMKMSM